MLTGFFKFVGVIVLIAGTSLAVVFLFGMREQTFTCTGKQIIDGRTKSTTFDLRFERLAWFVFWADDDGTAWLELQNGDQRLFLSFNERGPNWHFDTSSRAFPFGRFSTISKKAMIGVEGNHILEGVCEPTPEWE